MIICKPLDHKTIGCKYGRNVKNLLLTIECAKTASSRKTFYTKRSTCF